MTPRFLVLILSLFLITVQARRSKRRASPKLAPHEFEGFKSKKGVIHVNQTALASLKQSFDFVVVLFGAHVCAECSHLLKALEDIAPHVHSTGALVPFAHFTCETDNTYCEQAERINVAPTLRIYHKSMFIEYTSIKNQEGATRWIQDRLVHSSHNGTDQAREVKSLVRQSEVVVVLRQDETYRQFPEFRLLTIFYEFGHFFYTSNNKTLVEIERLCKEKVGETAEAPLFLINPENSKCYFYAESFNYRRAMSFIQEHDKIAVSRFDEGILRLQQKYQVPVAILFTRDALNHPFYPGYLKVAEEFKSKMVFAYVDEGNLDDPLVQRVMNTLGVDRRGFPAVRVMFKTEMGSIAKWKYEGQLDRAKFGAWVRRLLGRKVRVYDKAEDLQRLADENERGEIEKISALNFQAKVEEESQPIMLVIEGSEEVCEACSGLTQKVLDVRAKFTERQGKFPFKVYRLNVQLNEVRNWVFETVPQIVFVRRNKNIGVFAGEMEVNSVVGFMEEHLLSESDDAWREDL